MDGLKKILKKKIQDNRLDDKVILVGQTENVKDFYNAFDLYVFPSLFEGLSFVLIEAQANGLTCVSSDAVQHETNLSGDGRGFYLPLKIEIWKEKLLELGRPIRYDGGKCVIERGYAINNEAKKLESMYLKMAEKVVK